MANLIVSYLKLVESLGATIRTAFGYCCLCYEFIFTKLACLYNSYITTHVYLRLGYYFTLKTVSYRIIETVKQHKQYGFAALHLKTPSPAAIFAEVWILLHYRTPGKNKLYTSI
jgi:hypothetical protein